MSKTGFVINMLGNLGLNLVAPSNRWGGGTLLFFDFRGREGSDC